MAFRFPGDIGDTQTLWQALKEKRDLISKVPADRWAVDELQHAQRSEPGRSITFSAGVLSRIDEFDAAFFGISPREAAWLDPQQRLLLELAWEAMENGGQVPSNFAGSDCAVYIGISGLDYGTRGLDDLAAMSPYSMTGNTLSIAANRISYAFDLHGPSLAVDTACSSSLVALHHACACLQAGDATSALVGGVNMLLNPYPFVGFTKASMLSADGRCKAFDAEGNGYVRSEGGAILVLKPLSRAIADGDDIQAVILASGVNADGARKTGITIPSSEGQAELMRSVLAKSGLLPSDVDFVEAHGTGTMVGDPIEAAAIGSVYGEARATPLPIGSVKANLGHLEPASGMAGLVKAVLALKHKALPPALHLNTPNPHIDFQGLNLQLVQEYKTLAKESGKPLVAGVNSFGFGGANAHILLQEFKATMEQRAIDGQNSLPPLFLSARSDQALHDLAARYATLLSEKAASDFYDIAYAAAHRRERMEKRLALSADNPVEALDQLAAFAIGASPKSIFIEDALPSTGSIAFVYTGNGAQWLGMGRELMATSERFIEVMTQIDAIAVPLAGFSIIAELAADPQASRLEDTVVAQPLLFAIQVAVTSLLKELGVEPAAVTGHSVGEVAAAWAAGALDLEQAVSVICARSTAQGETRGSGRMAAVAMPAGEMRNILASLGEDLDIEIAGINSPGNITISGRMEDLERVRAYAESKRIFFRMLDLDYAFHTHHMDAIEETLLSRLEGLRASSSQNAVFVSTVTGEALDGETLGADYWWRNVRQPVQFAEAINTLVDLGCRIYLEIGPHAILQRYLRENLAANNIAGRILPTLQKGDDGHPRLLEAALRVQLLAEKPDFRTYFPQPGRHTRLPNYPWQRERHWHPRTREGLASIQRQRVHPLLGWRLHDAEVAWENVVDPTVLPWLADHQVGGAIVFPGAAYAEMALAAAHEWLGGERLAVEELDIVSPLVFDGEHARTLRFILNPRDGSFQIRSRQRLSDDAWALHAAGRLIEAPGQETLPRISLGPEAGIEIDGAAHYRLAAAVGLNYGPAFQGLARVRVELDALEAVLELPKCLQTHEAYHIHPALLDVCYQSLIDFFQNDIELGHGIALLPIKVSRLDVYKHSTPVTCRGRLLARGRRSVLAEFELLDAEHQLVARMSGCRFRAAPLVHKAQEEVSAWKILPVLQPHFAERAETPIPTTSNLLKQLRLIEESVGGQRHRWFKEKLPLFEALTLSFAYEAFAKVAEAGPDSLQQAVENASSYGAWLAGLLQQEGLLTKADGQWILVHAENAGIHPAQEIWQTLLRDAPDCLPQLTLMASINAQLPSLLTGATDVSELAKSLSRSPAAETLYDEDSAYQGTRRAITGLLQYLAESWPKERQLRVLEIGACPGDLPRLLSEALPEDRLRYVLALTDDESYQRQQVEYQELANVTVACVSLADWKLVAETALPTAFDVVILRHALHGTANPHLAVSRSRQWLASGGLLVLAERYPDWSADFISGLYATWWHVVNASEAESAPPQTISSLLPPEAWQQVMRRELGEGELYLKAASEGLAEGAYLLLGRRSSEEIIAPSEPDAASWLLLTDAASATVAGQLSVLLESRGQAVTVAEAVAEATWPQTEHVVYLAGWESIADDAVSSTSSLMRHVQAIANDGTQTPKLWLVTHGGALASTLPETSALPNPAQAALWGFGRVLMNEFPAMDCTLIDLAYDLTSDKIPAKLELELLWPDGTDEILLTEGARYNLRLVADNSTQNSSHTEAPSFRLDFHVPGQLRNLVWLPESNRALGDHEIEVKTHATGLNFRDVMYLMGLLPDEAVEKGFAGASLGLEFSGVVTRIGSRVRDFTPGDAVMGFGASCFASHVVTRDDAVSALPSGWSFEAAATVPTVFLTVYYSLKHLADLQPGERVLIHGAAGGVGVAAIQLARHLGAEVFATAGSNEKRDFVRLLGADHVFDSRSLDFADDILTATADEGVDVVLNSLAGEAIRRNLKILKPFGRFLELGKRDFFENTPIGLRPFKDNISYFGIDADQLLIGRPQLAARMFREVMTLFRDGVLSPLPYRAFEAERVVDAFRFMQQSRHIGKVVVSMKDAKPAVEVKTEAPIPVTLKKDATWLVSGGLSGFGLESARWLADRGVGHLALLGRRGMNTPGAADAIKALTAAGVHVHALACDVADSVVLGKVIAWVRENLPPLQGVLHAAATFDDRLIANLDKESLDAVLRPKLLGAWNLHQLTQAIPLEHFVLYSSITTSIGNPGQANYVAANAGLEGLALMRRHLGLPAICIGWGPIGDTGYLTRNVEVKESLAQRLGKQPLSTAVALSQLDRIFQQGQQSCMPANFDWSVLSRILPSASATRFAVLNRSLRDYGGTEGEIDIHAMLEGKNRDEAMEIIRGLVMQELAQILCMNVERIDPVRSLHELGLDSLMAVELALGLEQRFKIQLPVMMLNESPTADRVSRLIVDKLIGGDEQEEQDTITTLVSQLAHQHGEAVGIHEIAAVAQEAQSLTEAKARLLP